MSYKYDPYTDTFTHTNDEQSITVKLDYPQAKIVQCVSLTDETIDEIAESIVKKILERRAKMEGET